MCLCGRNKVIPIIIIEFKTYIHVPNNRETKNMAAKNYRIMFWSTYVRIKILIFRVDNNINSLVHAKLYNTIHVLLVYSMF
jgi:hypothetical protein